MMQWLHVLAGGGVTGDRTRRVVEAIPSIQLAYDLRLTTVVTTDDRALSSLLSPYTLSP